MKILGYIYFDSVEHVIFMRHMTLIESRVCQCARRLSHVHIVFPSKLCYHWVIGRSHLVHWVLLFSERIIVYKIIEG
jgi:hypothetical protein